MKIAIKLTVLMSALLLVACGSLRQNVSSTRNPAVNFTIAEPYALELAGSVSGSVPSLNQFIVPGGRMDFQLYTKEGQQAMDSFAIVSRTVIHQRNWEFDLERHTFHIVTQRPFREFGQFWTEQLVMVNAGQDWFAAFWKENGRSTPEHWIALRYSATPNPRVRILGEYREKATPCMVENWQNHPRSARQNLVNLCADDVKAFRERARATLGIKEATDEDFLEITPRITQHTNPRMRPNLGELVGHSKTQSQGRDHFLTP